MGDSKAKKKKTTGQFANIDVNSAASNILIRLAENKAVYVLLLAASIVSVVFYYGRSGDDYDLWWHLKYGEHYVNNYTWSIDHSVFSWTPSTKDWMYGTWLGSALLYLIYAKFSFEGLAILQWIILSSIAGLFYLYTRTIGTAFNLSHLGALLAVYIGISFKLIIIKPEVFGVLLFFIIVFVFFYSKQSSKKLYFIYPIIFVLWVNIHGSFLFGLFFLVVALISEALQYVINKEHAMGKRDFGILSLSILFSYIACALNPDGIYYPLSIIKEIVFPEVIHAGLKHVAEYKSLWSISTRVEDIYKFVGAWSVILMFCIFLAAIAVIYRKRGRFDIVLIFLNAVFFLFSMQLLRLSPYYPCVWLLSIFYLIRKENIKIDSAKGTAAALSAVAALLLIINAMSIMVPVYSNILGRRTEDYIPKKEAEFIKKNKLPAPIFNDYATGGFMIWALYPDYKVFIDPRYVPYHKTGVARDYFEQSNLYELYKKYPFKTCLLSLEEMYKIRALLASQEFRIVYFDKNAVVMVHKSEIANLKQETLKEDLRTARFQDVSDSNILIRLYNIYSLFGPRYAREIIDLYRKNVSDWYVKKNEKIKEMEDLTFQQEMRLRRF